jgi:hypothetical protein
VEYKFESPQTRAGQQEFRAKPTMESSMNTKPNNFYKPSFLKNLLIAVLTTVLVAGCAVTLVQPYDEKLSNDTEAFFKNASTLVDEGLIASPRTDEARLSIKQFSAHAGHFSKFEPKYDSLLRDADSLILRSLAKSGEIGPLGNRLQKKIEGLIQGAVPSACPELDAEFNDLSNSLTVRNYVDLKCYVINWKAQHSDLKVTENTQILKRVNWETRKSGVFNIILAIQKAEVFKKK